VALPPAVVKDSWSDRARLGLGGGQLGGSGFRVGPRIKKAALAAQPESLDHLMVSLHVLVTQVTELATSLANQLQ
jgi:hypothetical protein